MKINNYKNYMSFAFGIKSSTQPFYSIYIHCIDDPPYTYLPSPSNTYTFDFVH